MFVSMIIIAVALVASGCWALSANRNLQRFVDQETRTGLLGASVTIYKDAYLGKDPAGYL